VLVWDNGRLLAEFDRTAGANQLSARYYYFTDDVPIAADRRETDGQLHRYYFLSDAIGNVMALADGNGAVVSRYEYDAWGEFRPEAPDRQPPLVMRVTATTDAFQLEFNETILPTAGTPAFPALQTAMRSFGNVAVVRRDGTVAGGAWRYFESVAGAPFGAVLQFRPQQPLVGNVAVQVLPGMAMDSWNNTNAAQTFTFTLPAQAALGTVLASFNGELQPTTSPVLSPFLFQGQYFDPQAGLFYLRARFYDPFTGRFMQRDPEPYLDSPNCYAGFANNPTTLRDPSGRSLFEATVRIRAPEPEAPIAAPRGRGRAIPLDEATPPPASPRASSSTPVARSSRAQALEVDRAPAANAPVDRVAPTTARTRATAESVPPPARPPSATALAELEAVGRQRIAELEATKAQGIRKGRLSVVYEDLGEVSVENGQFTRGTLGTHKYYQGADKSVVRINARAKALADASPEGSILRKQIRVAELHELAHADNALSTKTSAPMGRGKYLEELGVHKEQIAIEYAVYGRDNPTARSAHRVAFEQGGDDYLSNALILDADYRELFNVKTREDAANLLSPYGFHLRIPANRW
jgi:RHS repeat-associated protein